MLPTFKYGTKVTASASQIRTQATGSTICRYYVWPGAKLNTTVTTNTDPNPNPYPNRHRRPVLTLME